jgi:ketohexokinase
MANILGVGIATLDIVNTVDGYPPEDAEVRAISQMHRRGGNVTNTLVVLSQLGHQTVWAGTLADDASSDLIRDDLTRYSVNLEPVEIIPGGCAPTSYITLNNQNGSRTIVHYRDLPEYTFESFRQIDLTAFDWLHFEGRNVEQTRQMLEHANKTVPHIPRSVEIEKTRNNIEVLCSLAHLLLYSRSYVENCILQDKLLEVSNKSQTPVTFLAEMHRQIPTADHVCTWGSDGAYGVFHTGEQQHASPKRIDRVVDTIGAGDTFAAGLIHARLEKRNYADSLKAACELAGKKCGQQGLDGLVP